MSHDAHGGEAGHEPSGGASGDGPAGLPPAPLTRSISPAPEDYALPFPGPGLLWPLVWLVFAIVLWRGAERTAGPVRTHGGHEGGAAQGSVPHGE
jgi:hypothetical protein